MNKWFGKIGYAVNKESSPGVWTECITIREYYGNLIRNMQQRQASSSLNDNLNVANTISIIADPFALQNFHAMRFVEFLGANWKIKSVEVQYPRLILTIGDVYNDTKGPTSGST